LIWQIRIGCMFHHSLKGLTTFWWHLKAPAARQCYEPVKAKARCQEQQCAYDISQFYEWKLAYKLKTGTSYIRSGNTSTDSPCAEGLLCCYFICSQIFRNGYTSLSKCSATCQKYIVVFTVTLWVIIVTGVLFAWEVENASLFAIMWSKELLSYSLLAFLSVLNIVS